MKTRTRTKMLLLLGVLLFGFTVSAWSQKVSLNFNNEKVEKILSSIKAQTGMGLVFSDQLIDVNRKISIQVKDASLDEALSKLLAGTKVTFEIKNRHKTQRKAKFYLNNWRSVFYMQGGLKQTLA